MHHLSCGISSLVRSVNLILFMLLIVHLILRISPHHSHHLLPSITPRPFILYFKLISFTNPFPHSLSDSFQTPSTDHGSLSCTELSEHWRLFCFSFLALLLTLIHLIFITISLSLLQVILFSVPCNVLHWTGNRFPKRSREFELMWVTPGL